MEKCMVTNLSSLFNSKLFHKPSCLLRTACHSGPIVVISRPLEFSVCAPAPALVFRSPELPLRPPVTAVPGFQVWFLWPYGIAVSQPP